MIICVQSVCKAAAFVFPSGFPDSSSSSLKSFRKNACCISMRREFCIGFGSKRDGFICGAFLPVDPWAPTTDSESIASQLFAFSLFPYLGFLYFITKSKTAPNLTLFGFYFLLAFVGATIPAGIYAKVHYGTSLSNVDWLHGGAESLLTLTNLFIVMGLRAALRRAVRTKQSESAPTLEMNEKNKSRI